MSGRLIGLGAFLAAGLWAYGAVGPAGLLPRDRGGFLETADVGVDPATQVARLDEALWTQACERADLPPLPSPDGLEREPVLRFLEAGRNWCATGEGDWLGRMGQVMLALGQHDPARDLFVAASELGDDKPLWTYFAAIECVELGDVELGFQLLAQAGEMDPDYGVIDSRLGFLHLERGELDLASQCFQAAAGKSPSAAKGLAGLAGVALEQGDFSAALASLDGALELTPLDYLLHRLRSQALAGLGRLDEARAASDRSNGLPIYRGWLSFDPRLVEAHEFASTQLSLENAMEVAIQSQDLGQAVKLAEKLVLRAPQSSSHHSTLASLYANTGNLKGANDSIARAVELQPGKVGLQFTKAEIALANGQPEIAIQAANAIRGIQPGSAAAHQLIGRARYVQKRYDEAIESLRSATAAAPMEDVSHRFMLAEVLVQAGRTDEASQELGVVLSRDGQHAGARALLARLKAGR